MSSSEDIESATPPDIANAAKVISDNLLPAKSRERYMAAYDQLIQWKIDKRVGSFSENVLLAYFGELAQKYKPSPLWAIHSMLKSTLKTKNCINIDTYTKLTAFMKKQSHGYICKKSKVLTGENVEKFINEAPDDKYLATKVALILGITGALRRQELYDLTTNDIETQGEVLLVKIPHTKNKIPRSFVVQGNYQKIVKKYQNLRSNKRNDNRFFQQLRNGKCTAQVIGKNSFGCMPKDIATYLNLPDANLYTGHSFRRTSATLLADSGADILTLKRHGGWRSNTVAEGYIEDSLHNKKQIDTQIRNSILKSCNNLNLKPQTTTLTTEPRASTSYASMELELNPCPSTTFAELEQNQFTSPTFTDMEQEQLTSDTAKYAMLSTENEQLKSNITNQTN